MKPFESILSRVIWLHVLAIAGACVVLPTAAYFLLSSTAAGFQNQVLRAHAETLGRYLQLQNDGHWTLTLPSSLLERYEEDNDGDAFSVVDESGAVLFSSGRSGAPPLLATDQRGPEPLYFQRTVNKALYYAASIPVRRGAHTAWIQVAQNLEHPDVIVDDIVAGFLNRIAWIVVPILLALLAVDIFIVRRALQPVLRVSHTAEGIGPAQITLRLPVGELPREIVPLVSAFNNVLDRLERAFRAQREFTANVAHELRTPLTVLGTRLDTLQNGEARQELRADVDRMARVVNQLLEWSELEGFTVDPTDRADLQAVCAEVVAFIAPLALRQRKEVALCGAPCPVLVRGNAEAIFRAIRNLVENAINHTPAGSTVTVEVLHAGTVRVLDEGPGIPEAERDMIFQRFWRRHRDRTGGTGLGLSIVAQIVDAHGGRITVENRPARGAAFSVTFHPIDTASAR